MSQPTMPSVALIVPIRNEHRHIDECLASLVAQTYPSDRLRIIVVDGESDDGTPDRVRTWMGRDDRISLLSNPERIMTAGLNRGITITDADIVGVVSGHSMVAPDYVDRSVAALRETLAWCVGGRIERDATSAVQRAIARATSSPVGVGDARHNYATQSGWTEAVFPGMWPRWVFDRVGLFDPGMTHNEDNELSHRIRAAGGKIWLDSEISVRYVPRGSFAALFAQYRNYGRGKVAVFRKHPSSIRWRHLVPPIWVASLSAMTVGGLVSPTMRWMGGLAAGVYVSLLAAASWSSRRPGDSVPLIGVAIAVIHAAYGVGIWQGVGDLLRSRLRSS